MVQIIDNQMNMASRKFDKVAGSNFDPGSTFDPSF